MSKSLSEIRESAIASVKNEKETSDAVFSTLKSLKDEVLTSTNVKDVNAYGALIESVEILCVRSLRSSDLKSKKSTTKKCGGKRSLSLSHTITHNT